MKKYKQYNDVCPSVKNFLNYIGTIKNNSAKTTISVISIDIITNEKTIYPSIAEAARKCKLNSSNIIEAINKGWRCGQWKWQYNKENINE